MKNLLLGLFSILFVNLTIAQSSQLTFVSKEGEKFWVVIDGVKVNSEPAFKVDARVGQAGFGAIKNSYVINIIFENENFKDIRRVIRTNHLKNYTFVLRRSGSLMRMKKVSGGYNLMPF